MSDTDLELLRRYNRDHAEDAFAEIVRRHLGLVYSAALRQVRSPQLAEEVAQSVFTDLARNARRLIGGGDASSPVCLSSWLYTVTRRTAVDVVRHEARRQLREQIATEMNAMNATTSDWTHIEPLLDEAMSALDDTDRAAVLLRYFESKSLREVGATLGTSDDAAQKRVSRAVERLREFFTKRGATVGAGGLIAAISANAVQAAPAGLAITISTAAVLAGTAIATTATVTKAIAMTTLQKTLVATTVAILAGAGIYQAHQASQLRDKVQSLHQTQAPLLDEMAKLKAENQRLSELSAQANATDGLSPAQLSELLKLRNKEGIHSRELGELKSVLARQTPKMDLVSQELSGFITSIADQGRRSFTNAALGKAGRMSAKMGLSPEQQQSVRNILLSNVEARTQADVARVIGDLSLDEVWNRKHDIDQDEDRVLAGLLIPDQMATYQQMKTDDLNSEAKGWRGYEISIMKRDLKLNDEQAEQLSSILSGLKRGEGGQGITYYSNAREQLEIRLRAFESVLAPQQLQTYRQLKLEDIEEHEQLPRIIQALKK